MKRTYRSKKETGGGLDPRDVVLAMDEKASAFDAFYIQNIKQSKREMSVEASMFAASNKVRKRKYVKRLKDHKPIENIRQSTSKSAYLTPDKSLRLNKAPDPFDMLLNSSTNKVSPQKSLRFKRTPDPFDALLDSSTNKVSMEPVDNVYSPLHTRGKGNLYLKKATSKKKVNYSASDTDSEKENDINKSNLTLDLSDVLSHELEIEKEDKAIPRSINLSINKIINDKTLLDNIQNLLTTSQSLTREEEDNCIVSLKSPLCSTPFHKKYRGKSIYKFSPIPVYVDDSKNHTITETLEESNRVGTENNEKSENNENITASSLDHKSRNRNYINSPILHCRGACTKNKSNKVISLLQTSEQEPFLGFSKSLVKQNINLVAGSEKYNKIIKDLHDDLQNSFTYNDVDTNYSIVENKNKCSSQVKNNNEALTVNITSEDVAVMEKSFENLDDSFSKIYKAKFCLENNTNQYNETKQSYAKESSVEAASHIYSMENRIDKSNHSSNEENNSIIEINLKDNTDQYNDMKQGYLNESAHLYSMENSSDESNHSSNEKTSSILEINLEDNIEQFNEIKQGYETECEDEAISHSFFIENSIDGNDDREENNSEYSQIFLEKNSIVKNGLNINNESNTLEQSETHSKKYRIAGNQSNSLNDERMSELIHQHSEDNSIVDNEQSAYEESISDVSQIYSEHNSIDNNEYRLNENNISDNSIHAESLYESCNSESEISEIETDKEDKFQEDNTKKVDSICESLQSDGHSNEIYSESYTSTYVNNTLSETIKVLSDGESNDNNLQEDSMLNISNHSQDFDCNYESNKSDDDVFVSFVTKRKRNEITKDSFILSLDNSLTSTSSGELDKTVLSNNKSSLNSLKQNNDNTLLSDAQINNNEIDTAQICDKEYLLQKENTVIETVKTEFTHLPKTKRTSVIPKKCDTTRKKSKLSIGSINRQSFDEEHDLISRKSVVPHNNIMTRRSTRLCREHPNTKTPLTVHEVATQKCTVRTDHSVVNDKSISEIKQGIILEPGKRWERSLSIYRRVTTMGDFEQSILEQENHKGRKYRQSVITTMEMQDISVSLHNESVSRRSTLYSKPSRATIKIVRESNASRISLSSTSASEDLGFLTEDCDDTIVELSKLSIIDSEHEVTVLDKFNDTSNRITTARDYVLRRCNQTDVILFDECYPDTALKNCRKIGEGVYGEVFLWRAGDGRARVLKIVPIAGHTKVNGESQKDYHEIISEIVIAMELSALRAPIIEIEKHLDEGQGIETLDLHSVENATDVFNEVLAVHCVCGSYPSRLLDLWELYDECKGSENDNPAVLPAEQQFMVLELANAGQDLESYQFHNAEQAYALFKQVAFGLAVAEEAYQFEHRDLHWGNVLIAPTDQKYATFVLRGRTHRAARRGVAATIIDYSLSRLSLRLPRDSAALYNDLAADDGLFDALGDYQFEVYRLMRDKLGNDWKNFEPYTNILWLHYTVDKMITSLRYTRTNTKIHKHYIAKLKEIKNRILDYESAVHYVLTDNEL